MGPATGRVSASVPPPLVDIASRVEVRVRALLEAERERWTTVDDALGPPFDALIEVVLAGGKRLRPALCHWASVAAGGDPDVPRLTDAQAAVELRHNMPLIHAAVMDGSSRRLGVDAIHIAF